MPEEVPPGRKSLSQRLEPLDNEVLIQELSEFEPHDHGKYVMGFTGSKMSSLLKQLEDITFDPLVHTSAIISENVTIGDGTIIGAGVIIAPNTEIGKHVFVNRGVTIGHDTIIGDYSVINPGANIAGHVKVGRGVLVGMGANIIQDRSVGDEATVGAGAVVIRDVRSHSLVVGVPAIEKAHGKKK
jgi:sugar O-acyltransferase (sialic acid O-acetyltransferase NeuD family)